MNIEKVVATLEPITSQKQYDAMLKLADTLMDAKKGTVKSNLFNLITMLIEDYEEEHFNIPPPDPVDAIKFRMEQLGLTAKDVEAFIGSKSRVSEILNRKRRLTLKMRRSLHENLGIPAESLLKA